MGFCFVLYLCFLGEVGIPACFKRVCQSFRWFLVEEAV